MKKGASLGSKIIIYTVLILCCLICIIPLITVVSVSFSDDMRLIKEGYGILPKGFSLEGYEYVFRAPAEIIRAYGVTILVTILGLVFGVSINALLAYVLSVKEYRFHKQLTIFLLIPMLLSGGIVSSYIWITSLNLKNTLWVMFVPSIVSPWNVIMMRTFFLKLPYSLKEAATIDGAGQLTIFTKIILPLSKPVLATIGMLTVLAFWNDWYAPLLYITDPELYNLQYRLYLIMKNVQEMTKAVMNAGMNISLKDLPTESMRMAMCVISAGPMLFVFPFFQKYLVKGLTVGGVKE